MRARAFLFLLLCAAAGLIQVRQPLSHPTAKVLGSVQAQLWENYGKLPLYFIENQGQLDPRVAYYIHGGDKSIYFTAEGVTYALTARKNEEPESRSLVRPVSFDGADILREPDPPTETQRWVLKQDFVGANPNVQPVGQGPTDAVVSYFKGPQEEWETDLTTYAEIAYRDLWPGIDLVYSGTSGRLKYTFLVHPGADVSQIKLAYRGATKVQLNEVGQLEISTPLKAFYEDKAYVYQEVNGQRVEVDAAYSLDSEVLDGVQYGFRIGEYDRSKILVLDPVVVLYAGYIGGIARDGGHSIAVDATGNAYVTGVSFSASFPVTVLT